MEGDRVGEGEREVSVILSTIKVNLKKILSVFSGYIRLNLVSLNK